MESEIKVLVVDDDDVILFLHELMIRDSGLSPDVTCFLTARGALDHLEAIATGDQRFLVLLDINMPGINGWEFLGILAEAPYRDRVSVVLVTSSIDYADHQKAKNFPAVLEYVEKPLTAAICARIRKAVPGR